MRIKEDAVKHAHDRDAGENYEMRTKRHNNPDDVEHKEGSGSRKQKNKRATTLPPKKRKQPVEDEAPTTLPPVKEKKSLAKKRKQAVEDVDEVEKVEPQKKQRKRHDSNFIIHCQANGLCKLASTLQPAHKKDVEVVGFGGMLLISGIHVTKTKLIRWLVERFNGCSQMLEINDMNRFVVTADDIRDVFMLPNGGQDVVRSEVKRNEKNEPDKRGLLVEWEAKYGIKESVSLTDIKHILETKFVDVGGPDFQRLFVLYSISSFLAPLSNQKMDWGILDCVADVGKISSYNWCSYVLRRLCAGVDSFRTTPGSKNISGCVLVLQILYFHRMKWKGRAEPSSLPLIQHWTTEKFNKRMKEEESAGGWGKGEWTTHIFPISSINECKRDGENDERAEVKKDEGVGDGCGQEGRPIGPTKHVQFELMAGDMDDEEIRRVAHDETHETILFFKRDIDIVSRAHHERLLKLTKSIKGEGCVESGPDGEMTASQKFWSNEDVLRICDEIEAHHKRMKAVMNAIPMPSFKLLTPEPLMDAETEAAVEEIIRREEAAVADIPEKGWPVRDSSAFKCMLMRKNMKLFDDFSRKEKDVVDYCFSHPTLSEKKAKPNVFMHCSKYFISFDAIESLNDGRSVSPLVVDAWALLLNKRSDGKCFYMNTQHSQYLNNLATGVEGEVDFGEKLRGCWDDWVNNMQQQGDLINLGSFDFIFVPNFVGEHFFAIVVNVAEDKVQYLDNMTHSKVKNSLYKNLQNAVKSQMAVFLHEKEHPKAGNVEQFKVEDVRFKWKGCSGKNSDSGIILMNHMEFFRGHPYENPKLKNPVDRLLLRAQYCVKILLSDVNQMKTQLEEDVIVFSESRM